MFGQEPQMRGKSFEISQTEVFIDEGIELGRVIKPDPRVPRKACLLGIWDV